MISQLHSPIERSNADWLNMGLEQEIVYIAGPVTLGNWVSNLRNAVDAAETLSHAGFLPIIPHLNIFWDLIYPHPYEFWLYRITLPLIKKSNYVLRIPGESRGADEEIEFAYEQGIPVYYFVDHLIKDHGGPY